MELLILDLVSLKIRLIPVLVISCLNLNRQFLAYGGMDKDKYSSQPQILTVLIFGMILVTIKLVNFDFSP